MGFQSRNSAAALQESIHRSERFPDDLLHSHETAADSFLRELEYLCFGVVEDLFRGVTLLRGARDSRCGRVDQGAQQRLVAHDLDVILDAWAIGNSVEQPGDVSRAADRL